MNKSLITVLKQDTEEEQANMVITLNVFNKLGISIF